MTQESGTPVSNLTNLLNFAESIILMRSISASGRTHLILNTANRKTKTHLSVTYGHIAIIVDYAPGPGCICNTAFSNTPHITASSNFVERTITPAPPAWKSCESGYVSFFPGNHYCQLHPQLLMKPNSLLQPVILHTYYPR